jgi:hypothetical protein
LGVFLKTVSFLGKRIQLFREWQLLMFYSGFRWKTGVNGIQCCSRAVHFFTSVLPLPLFCSRFSRASFAALKLSFAIREFFSEVLFQLVPFLNPRFSSIFSFVLAKCRSL